MTGPAISGIGGHVDLTVESGARIVRGTQTALGARIVAPGGSIGRSPEATIVLDDQSRRISRVHVVFELEGPAWTVRDWGSSHGSVVSHQGTRAPLTHGMREPVHPGMRLLLGRTVQLRIDAVDVARSGDSTFLDSGVLNVLPQLLDAELRDFAWELCAPYRQSPSRSEPAAIPAVADRLHIARRTAYNRVDALCSVPVLARLIGAETGSQRTRRLAAALVQTFPELGRRVS